MDSQIIAAYIGLSGVGIGIFFSGLAYFWKVRTEQKRIINKILYFLLEVRHQINLNYLTVSRMNEFYTNLLDEFFVKHGLDLSQLPRESMQAIEFHFGNLISSLKTSESYSMETYQNLIVSLAETRPLLAFKLSSIDIFPSLVRQQEKYKAKLPFILDENQFTPEIEKIANNLNEDAISQLVSELNELILLVSFKCGFLKFLHFYVTIKLYKKPKLSLSKEEKDDIESAMTELLLAYAQQLPKT